MALTILYLVPADERLDTRKFTKWQGNFHRSVTKGKRALPLEVVYNFRTNFAENNCSI